MPACNSTCSPSTPLAAGMVLFASLVAVSVPGANGPTKDNSPADPATEPDRVGTLVPTGEDPGEALRLPTLSFSVDPYLAFDTGADFTGSAVAGIAVGEELALGPLSERPAAGVAARAVRLLVFDLQVSFWFTILQHEAFGHGGRAREFGSDTSFSMGSPWGFGRNSSAGFDEDSLSNDDLLRVYAGGVQSNGWVATRTTREMVAGRPMRSLELLFAGWNRYATSAYVLRNTPDPADDPRGFFGEWSGGGDAARYLGYLNTRFFGTSGIEQDGIAPSVEREYDRLERQAWWNLLDPALWISVGEAVRNVRRGDAPSPLPLPRLFGRRFLPVLSADWLLDGGTYSLEAVFGGRPEDGSGDGAQWFSVVARSGRGPGGSFRALGAATEKLWQTPALRWGGEMEVWSQADDSLGGGFRLDARVRRGGLRNVFFQFGVKSDGEWPGRPAGVGPFIRLGYRLPL